ncbi:uncharacterized protein LOC114248303 isoform X1 [Bombyx mandarina]|uniref:Uncharacterized protein LOC114248303 isoform X1 n=1 Tax=Bombyx mandarina TaxID=7092 RepID=A0A6J2K5T6_BOMMA|nr:uncharacterized protein LOC114248303 isoform X1 [Bombyx mandarina]
MDMEMAKIFTNVPKSAFQLYIKLYCNRRAQDGIPKSIAMTEAIQTWVSLKETEKYQFLNKYNECKERNIKKIGECIKQAEVFVKKRHQKRSPDITNNESSVSNILETSNIEEIHLKSAETPKEVQIGDVEEDNNLQLESIMHDEIEELLTKTNEENQEFLEESSLMPNPEPMPPTIKSGRELFAIIKTTNENGEVTWDTLSNKERSYYSRAILTLKNDYIHKYKLFLESLGPRELFDYYNKTFC